MCVVCIRCDFVYMYVPLVCGVCDVMLTVCMCMCDCVCVFMHYIHIHMQGVCMCAAARVKPFIHS